MRGPLLALLAALAVGSATGAVAFTSARDAVTPGPPAATPSGAAVVPAASDPCADAGGADPACVVVVTVPAAVQASGDNGTITRATEAVAPAPKRPGVKLRGDGSVDDCCGGIDDDRSGRRGGHDASRPDDHDHDHDHDHDDEDDEDRDDDEDDER
jgi:hypothetical protein